MPSDPVWDIVLNDLGYMLDTAVYYLWLAAFVDDHRQADAEQQRSIAWAQAHPAAGRDPEEARAHKAADIYSDGRPVTTTLRFGDGEDDGRLENQNLRQGLMGSSDSLLDDGM